MRVGDFGVFVLLFFVGSELGFFVCFVFLLIMRLVSMLIKFLLFFGLFGKFFFKRKNVIFGIL